MGDVDLEIFNKSEFEARFVDHEELIPEFLQTFFDHADNYMANLKKALDEGSPKNIEIAAHSTKGMIANFACERCVGLAYRLEQMGKQASHEKSTEVFIQLENNFLKLKQALQIYRESLYQKQGRVA